jgi:hypothetical protein
MAFAPYTSNGTLSTPSTPKISISYDESNVTSFDPTLLYAGCYLSTQDGVVGPAFQCTIRFTGIKAGSEEEVVLDVPLAFTNKPRCALFRESVQRVDFFESFRGLRSLEPAVLTPTLPLECGGNRIFRGATVRMGFDEFRYTAHVKNDT